MGNRSAITSVLRWIAVLPGSVLISWVVYFVAGTLVKISIGDPDPSSIFSVATEETLTGLAIGLSLVASAACIAPKYKKQTSVIIAALALIFIGFDIALVVLGQSSATWRF
jgi:hypothetical protein